MQKKLLAIVIASTINSVWATSPAEDNNVLDDVIVSATRSEINTAEAPASVTVINHQDIEKKGAENIVDIIRGTTGVTLQGIGTGGRKGISLRGMSSKHTLILIDGKRIPSSNDNFGPNTDYQYDWIPVGNIERVEIVRGPMSVLYGADALGGVINIITRKPSKKLHGNIKLTGYMANGDHAHDGDGHAVNFNLSGSVNQQLQFSVGGLQSRRESVESKLKQGQSAIEGRDKQQLALGFDWQPNAKNNIKLEYTIGQEDRWYDTQTRRKKGYQSQYDINRKQASLGWKGKLGEMDASLRVYKNSIDIVNKATNGVRATPKQKLDDTTFDGSLSFPLGQKQLITTGFEHRKETLSHKRLKGGKGNITFKSLYLQDEIDLSDNLLVTLGARLDDHETFGKETSPRASIVWNATEHLILKSSYGHGFRAPNIKQSSADYVFSLGTINIKGNPNLKPETNDAFEVGANYHAKNYSVDVSIFDNKVKNLIDLTGPINNRTYKNVREARLKGIELASNIALRKGLKLSSSYQYLNAKDADGQRLKHRPQHTLSSGLTWNKNSWQIYLGAEHVSGQIIEHNRVSTDVAGYTLWNARVSKSLNKHMDLALGIDNVTNVRLEDKSSAFLHEEYPRTVRLELKGQF